MKVQPETVTLTVQAAYVSLMIIGIIAAGIASRLNGLRRVSL